MLNKTEFIKKLPFAVCRRTAKNVAVQGRTAPFAVRFAFAVRLVAFSSFSFLFYLF